MNDELKVNNIYLGDCLDVMGKMPSESVDLILTSPPYNLGTKHHTGNNVFKAYKSYNDNLPESDYQAWQLEVLSQCFRILKPSGSMLYNHKNRIRGGVQLTPYEWLLKSEFVIKQEIVWFNRSQNFDKIRFYPMTERVYWLAKSPKTKLFNAINHHDVFNRSEWKPNGTKGKFKRAFPLKMAEDLLLCFPDSKIVLDPFIGSGTTAVACINTGRNYIGIELDKHYFEMTKERIENHVVQKNLDLGGD